jgi:hypothetical protein
MGLAHENATIWLSTIQLHTHIRHPATEIPRSSSFVSVSAPLRQWPALTTTATLNRQGYNNNPMLAHVYINRKRTSPLVYTGSTVHPYYVIFFVQRSQQQAWLQIVCGLRRTSAAVRMSISAAYGQAVNHKRQR